MRRFTLFVLWGLKGLLAMIAVDAARAPMEISQIERGILGDDVEVRDFWDAVANEQWIAVGDTPNGALAALAANQDRC